PRPAMTQAATVGRTAHKAFAPRTAAARPTPKSPNTSTAAVIERAAAELTYETVDWAPETNGRITDALYEGYGLQSIRIPGSQAHPTPLRQVAAIGSGAPPQPPYPPPLPPPPLSARLLPGAHPLKLDSSARA